MKSKDFFDTVCKNLNWDREYFKLNLQRKIKNNGLLLKLNIESKDSNSKARTGWFQTEHGKVETPIFMPVGTQGTVKAVNQDYLANEIKAQIVL